MTPRLRSVSLLPGHLSNLLAGQVVLLFLKARFTPDGRIRLPGSRRNWHPDDPGAVKACPLGVAGDSLWVREAFSVAQGRVWYRSDGLPEPYPRLVWRSGHEMPFWAHRFRVSLQSARLQWASDGDGREWVVTLADLIEQPRAGSLPALPALVPA